MLAVYLPWEIISNYFQFRIQAIQAVPENMDRCLSYLILLILLLLILLLLLLITTAARQKCLCADSTFSA
jgi:hypothetical protein